MILNFFYFFLIFFIFRTFQKSLSSSSIPLNIYEVYLFDFSILSFILKIILILFLNKFFILMVLKVLLINSGKYDVKHYSLNVFS